MSRPDGKLRDDDYCFACGKLNPHGIQMRVEFDEDERLAFCRVVLPRRFQGWSGMAHGGVTGTLLDEIMAHAVIHFWGQAVTVEMHTRYRAPVPLGKELMVRGWVEDRRRRMIQARAELHLAGEEDKSRPLAQATARFMLLDKCD